MNTENTPHINSLLELLPRQCLKNLVYYQSKKKKKNLRSKDVRKQKDYGI